MRPRKTLLAAEGWRDPAMIAVDRPHPTLLCGDHLAGERQVGESASPRLDVLRSIDQNENRIKNLACIVKRGPRYTTLFDKLLRCR